MSITKPKRLKVTAVLEMDDGTQKTFESEMSDFTKSIMMCCEKVGDEIYEALEEYFEEEDDGIEYDGYEDENEDEDEDEDETDDLDQGYGH